MATTADTGFGVLLKVGDGGSPTEVFTVLSAEVRLQAPGGYSRDAVDASHTQSPDQFREYIAGMMDAGEVSIELNFVPAAADEIVALVVAGKQNYQILFPARCTWTFAAICTNYQPSTPIDDKMTATATFKVSGKPTLAAV
jgi:predicted secreted protein